MFRGLSGGLSATRGRMPPDFPKWGTRPCSSQRRFQSDGATKQSRHGE